MERTVVALYDDMNTAQRALEELLQNGFDRNDISVVRTDRQSVQGTSTVTDRREAADNAAPSTSGLAAGAGIGAVLGGMAGLLVGLGALAIPGIGPIVAAGPLAAALGGAGIGAAAGGILGVLVDAGIPENQAGYYAEGIRRGGTLLTVRTTDEQVTRATQILNRYQPVDIDRRATEWRSSGWTGFDPNAEASSGTYTGTSTSRFEDFDDDFRSDWDRRFRSSGYGYERYQPAYRYGWEAHNRYRDRNWSDIEPELRSDWQRNHPNDTWEEFKDSIKTGWERFKHGVKEAGRDIDRGMDRMSGTGMDRTTGSMRHTYDSYDPYFRSDWEESFRSRGIAYGRYQPAYQYGYDLAMSDRYRGRHWSEIETEARRDWEMRHPNDRWEDFKDAVQRAWDRVRADVKDAVD